MIETTQLNLGDTTFHVSQLPATKMWQLSEYVRHALGTTEMPNLNGADESDQQVGLTLFRAIAAISPTAVLHVRTELFGYVEFSNRLSPTPQRLAGAEEMAFDAMGLSGLDIYMVLWEAFRLNFSPYWEEFASLAPDLNGILSSSRNESPPL